MGFGFLLLGYVIEFIGGLYGYGRLVSVLGCAAMFAGLSALGRYCRLFRRAQYVTPALAAVGVYRTFWAAEELFSLSFPFVLPGITEAVNWLYTGLLLAFHVFLALAIKELSLRVNLPKCAVAALRNLVMVAAYVLLLLSASLFPQAVKYLPALAQLAAVVFSVLYAILLVSCYMRIRPAEEDEDAPPPPSRFAFVNRFREAFSRREEKAIEADRKWHEEENKKRLARLSQKQRDKRARRGGGGKL